MDGGKTDESLLDGEIAAQLTTDGDGGSAILVPARTHRHTHTHIHTLIPACIIKSTQMWGSSFRFTRPAEERRDSVWFSEGGLLKQPSPVLEACLLPHFQLRFRVRSY